MPFTVKKHKFTKNAFTAQNRQKRLNRLHFLHFARKVTRKRHFKVLVGSSNQVGAKIMAKLYRLKVYYKRGMCYVFRFSNEVLENEKITERSILVSDMVPIQAANELVNKLAEIGDHFVYEIWAVYDHGSIEDSRVGFGDSDALRGNKTTS